MLFGEFAKSQAEAEYPELWQGMAGAYSPALNAMGGVTLYDWGGKRKHGTLTNMDPATDWVVSGGRQSLDLDGTDDYVNLGSFVITGQRCIAMWVKPDAITDDIRLAGNTNNTAFGIRFQSSGVEIWGNSWAGVGLSVGSSVGQWTQFVFNWVTTNGCNAWMNLTQGSTTAFASDVWSNIGFGAKLNNTYGSTFDGCLGDVCLYNRQLSVWEIALRYRLGPGGWATPRRRRWNYVTAQTAIPYWVFGRKDARLIGGGVS